VALTRGRVIADVPPGDATPIAPPGARGHVIDRAIVLAEQRAVSIVAQAEAEAARIVAEAFAKAASARDDAEREGRQAGVARLAAAWMRLRDEEAKAAARAEQHTIEIARVLAERLLGQALVLDPSLIVALARQTLTAVSRARRILLVAHPDDAEALKNSLGELGLDGAVIDVAIDASRPRGGLRVETDLGTLDADLAPQLDRLVLALR
jgi:flagellar biosynthesis/type III secretory pathway protein FliH